VLTGAQPGQTMDISGGREHAVSIPVNTGVRDFAFSADGSALAVVDYHGDILLWALCSDPSFFEFYSTFRLKAKSALSKPAITYTLPSDLNPCSIQFLESGEETSDAPFTPLLLVGSSYNRRLHLVDVGKGMILQEIVLPSISSDNMPAQNFPMTYTKEKRFLTLGDTLSNSIFFFHLSFPALKDDSSTSESDYLVKVAEQTFSARDHDAELAGFDYVTELPFFPHHRLQTLAVTTSIDAFLDVFTAHNNGFTMLSPTVEDLLPENYLEAKQSPTNLIPTPELNRTVQQISRECSPSPKSLSPRSSSENLRSGRRRFPPLVKNETLDDTNETILGDEQQPRTNKVVNETKGFTEVVSKDISASASASDTPMATTQTLAFPTQEVGEFSKELETFSNQIFEQQRTSPSPLMLLLTADQHLVNEQKHLMAIADDRHESILKVVSSTLTTNVGKLLEQTVRTAVEKSILPAINATVKKSVDQQLTKILANPLEKTFPKELRAAVNDAVQKALFGNDRGAQFSDTITTSVAAKLETTLQKDLSSRFGTMFEKTLGPIVAKLEERLQASFDRSIQKIQKETRASQQEVVKKLDALTDAMTYISEYVKIDHAQARAPTSSSPATASQVFTRKQTMAEQFKAGNYSAAIEIVLFPSRA
jgi:hypothetical protein